MNTTHANFAPGDRHDITVEFITRRTVDADGERLHRLLVDDQHDTRFPLLTTPGRDACYGLKTGDTYHVEGLLAVNTLHITSTEEDTSRRTVSTHPALRAAVEELGLDGIVGVIDERTTVHRASRSSSASNLE